MSQLFRLAKTSSLGLEMARMGILTMASWP